MTAASKEALVTLRCMARGHAGASSGETAAWEILANLRDGAEVDLAGDFVQLLLDLTTGGTGLSELN